MAEQQVPAAGYAVIGGSGTFSDRALERSEVARLREKREALDQVRTDIERARRDYDLQKAAETSAMLRDFSFTVTTSSGFTR